MVTSDRGFESAARTARTTYVVTAAQIARDGDRTVADAHRSRSRRQYRSLRRLRRCGDRRDSRQLVAANSWCSSTGCRWPAVRSTTSISSSSPVSGIDRIEVVEGGGSTLYGSGSIGGVINIITAAPRTGSAATLATGSFNEQTYLLADAVSHVSTHLRDERLLGGQLAEPSKCASRFDRRRRALRARDRGGRRNPERRSRATRWSGAPGELGYFSPTSEQSNVNRNLRFKRRT